MYCCVKSVFHMTLISGMHSLCFVSPLLATASSSSSIIPVTLMCYWAPRRLLFQASGAWGRFLFYLDNCAMVDPLWGLLTAYKWQSWTVFVLSKWFKWGLLVSHCATSAIKWHTCKMSWAMRICQWRRRGGVSNHPCIEHLQATW